MTPRYCGRNLVAEPRRMVFILSHEQSSCASHVHTAFESFLILKTSLVLSVLHVHALIARGQAESTR
jgi:hypothetical protein